MKTGRYIQVCVNLPELPDNRLYDYHVPADWPFVPALGCRVLVPFAGRRAEAIVWACQEPTYPERIKDVLAVLDELPLLTPEQMSLIDWLARRYFCRRQDFLRLFLPPGLKAQTEKCWRLTGTGEDDGFNQPPSPAGGGAPALLEGLAGITKGIRRSPSCRPRLNPIYYSSSSKVSSKSAGGRANRRSTSKRFRPIL